MRERAVEAWDRSGRAGEMSSHARGGAKGPAGGAALARLGRCRVGRIGYYGAGSERCEVSVESD